MREKTAPLQMILVKYLSGSDAILKMYERSDRSSKEWNCILECDAYVGRDGIGKVKEGDFRSPVGVFPLEQPFGILPDPGCQMNYLQLKDHLYWCADRPWYNQLISIKKHPHHCTGEHLVDYVPHYHYAMFIGYNKECTFNEGSAIFLHCKSQKPYTGGCVAVDEDKMKFILQHVTKGAVISIFDQDLHPADLIDGSN